MEKEAEEFKMGFDAQKSFAQMHEVRNMNKGIGGHVMKLDPEQGNWGSSDEAGSCSNAGAQRKNTNIGAPIPVQNKEQNLRFRPYFHMDDLHPRQDVIGWRIFPAKDQRKLGFLGQIQST